MSDVKVKNSGAPVIIGGKIVDGYGAITSVNEAALKDYCKAVAGNHVFVNFLTVVDEDYDKKKKAEAAALEAKAVNEAKAKIMPEVEAELTEKIGKKFAKEIKGLNGKIETLNGQNKSLYDEKLVLDEKIISLNGQVKDLTEENFALNAGSLESGETANSDNGTNDGEFVLDPEKHHIEHRGGGSWYVMDQEEKVHGPLSEEDRKKFEDMLK